MNRASFSQFVKGNIPPRNFIILVLAKIFNIIIQCMLKGVSTSVVKSSDANGWFDLPEGLVGLTRIEAMNNRAIPIQVTDLIFRW